MLPRHGSATPADATVASTTRQSEQVMSQTDAELLPRWAAADEALAKGNARGALHGVPLAHKDMYYRAGTVATCGSKIRRDWLADRTATALARLDRAGALQLGTLNMAEFALGPTGHNEHF